VETIGGCCYFISFTDDYLCLTHIYLLHHKSEAFEAWANTQHDAKIKCLHSDHGGEYLSKGFTKHLMEKGTEQKFSVHNTPEQEGVTEVLNHINLEHMKAILHTSGLLKFLWGEALHHMIWLKNRTSTVAIALKTPFEAVTGKKPNLAKLPEWGCAA
jgi:transposase InsO family protein